MSGSHVFAERNRIPADVSARLAIVVEELVINLYDHGGLGDADPVELELRRADKAIHLIITDTGEAFDIRRISEPSPIPARGGGAGIALVKAWASELDYRQASGTNRLNVTLPL